jgi:hypothetical protein
MEFTARTHALADRAVKNMAVQLAQRGALPPEAARQMCDGFVSPTNLRQAEQAMALARATGDRTSYQFAKNLHFALGVQMQFQGSNATRREAVGDAFESQAADNARRSIYGADDGAGCETPGSLGAPDCFPGGERNSGPGFGTGLVVGGLFAAAVAMMARGRNNNRNERSHNRTQNHGHRNQDVRRDVHVRRDVNVRDRDHVSVRQPQRDRIQTERTRRLDP